MIYFIQHGKDGPIKIGFTKNRPERRVLELQSGNPFKLTLLHYVDGDTSVEDLLHHRFRNFKIRGEWFEPSPKLLAHIEKLKAISPIRPKARAVRKSKLRDWRKQAGMTQSQFAKELGMKQSNFSKLEANGTASLSVALKIKKYTNGQISADDVMRLPA